jgi:uridine phosphorylase
MTRICPHLLLEPGSLPEVVLIPGDPQRATRIAERLERPEKLAENREFRSYRGMYRDVPVAVISTGVGGPSAAICVEEAIRSGARTFLRVGTAGSISDRVHAGDLVVVHSAVRGDGTSRLLVPIEVPAVADPDVVAALWTSAGALGGPTHCGMGVAVDAFYRGALDLHFDEYAAAGALCVEMECATVYVVSALRRARAGAIVAIDGDARSAASGDHDPYRDSVREAVDREISVALDAAVRLASVPDRAS